MVDATWSSIKRLAPVTKQLGRRRTTTRISVEFGSCGKGHAQSTKPREIVHTAKSFASQKHSSRIIGSSRECLPSTRCKLGILTVMTICCERQNSLTTAPLNEQYLDGLISAFLRLCERLSESLDTSYQSPRHKQELWTSFFSTRARDTSEKGPSQQA